jgi:hypothetical protein
MGIRLKSGPDISKANKTLPVELFRLGMSRFGIAASAGFHAAPPEERVFRFTKFWEKNIVIIREKWSVGIMINKEWLEPRLA